MIEYNNISKVFKSELLKDPFIALDEISFKIPTGKIIGFLGANGAGKTTLIKITMDFIRATDGEIIYDKELGSSKELKFSNIGYLPERPFFYPYLTGREFCNFMGELCSLSKEEIKTQVEYWGARFKIDFALDRKIKTYSKGMLQRVGFLVTLLHKPKLVILDEPLSGLDPIGRKELKEIILEINKLGTTVFFSSHIVADVQEVCDEVVFIKDGKLIFQGNVDEVITENLKPEVIFYYKLNDEYKHENIHIDQKNEKLKELIEKKADIISINTNKPTLEEIFYNVN